MRGLAVYIEAVLLIPLLIGPIPAQIPTPVDQPQRREPLGSRERGEFDLERRMRDMRVQEGFLRATTSSPAAAPAVPKLTSEARERVLRLRRLSTSDISPYATFLKQDRTGVFKLFPDLGCVSKNVIRVDGECERFVPMSSSFTFRTNGYSDKLYHDIHFGGDRISSNSFFSQGIFVEIGDEPIETVGLTHPGLKFLADYRPVTDPTTATQHTEQFRTGVDSGGYKYADHVFQRENVTYALRMIAYRVANGLRPLSADTTTSEMMFLSLSHDKRVDITVVFRVLSRDEHGGLTIVWKELERADAPKIKFEKGQLLRDFRAEDRK